MSKVIAHGIALIIVCTSALSAAFATDLGLITGSEGGTYYRFGLDLKKLARAEGVNLTVLPSKGSVENIFAVYQRRADMGIVQSDVLDFVGETSTNVTLASIARSIRMVLPLYDEDVHVIARNDIGSFEQLGGKRVAIGREGSGTYLTAQRLFKLAGIRASESVPTEGHQALAQLKAGRVDAMIYVAPAPVQLLKHGVRTGDGLALIPISSKAVLESYAGSEIAAHTYDWQAAPVSTVAVKAILVAFDLRGPECEKIGRFAHQVAGNMEWLTKNGHPAWRRVDLDYRLPGWEPYDCAQTSAGKSPDASSPSASARERNPVADAVERALGHD